MITATRVVAATAALLIIITLGLAGCSDHAPPATSTVATAAPAPSNSAAPLVLFNKPAAGTGSAYAGDNPTTSPAISVRWENDAESSNIGVLAVHGEGPGMIGGLWQLPAADAADVSSRANLLIDMKIKGPQKIQAVFVRLHSATSGFSTNPNAADYLDNLMDGQYHQVVLPLKDFTSGMNGYDLSKLDGIELQGYSWIDSNKNFTIYVKQISFDNRRATARSDPLVFPVTRQPKPIAADAPLVNAEVNITDDGKPISPWIYGACCDAAVGKAAGLTIIREGGNPTSTVNWRGGFWSSGGDWYFVNNPANYAPAPPQERFKAFGNLKKMGLEVYQTIPTMGRVAKDGTSVGFDVRKYPDQTDWEGKSHPGDLHPYAGNGEQYVRDEKGQFKLDAKGNRVTRGITPNPDDVSISVTPDEQCAELEFEVKNMGYGRADQGGIKFVALDNEPMLWSSTHECFHPAAVGYDELWQRTVDYASRLKTIDPSVKIAGPVTWGWSDLYYSGLDTEMVRQGKGTWKDPPDFVAHGRVPFVQWWMKNLAAYQKEHGVRLCDILDFHFYAQCHFMGGNSPQAYEERVQETRVYWDPTYKDQSWMGAETDHVICIIPKLKKWIADCNPGMMLSIGEYTFDAGDNISGGITETETLGIFAREGLDMAFLWGEPGPNSSIHFGVMMVRNPDGKFTSFGDRYLPSTVDAPLDVSVHVGRDSKTGRLSFILVNKRGLKDARVKIKLSKAIPQQQTTPYEYSDVNRRAIGQLPPLTIGGDTIEVNLPAMSVLRFDAMPLVLAGSN